MGIRQFKESFQIASDMSIDLSMEDISIFMGYGKKDFVPVCCTKKQIASLMRYQGLQLNGAWDMEEVNEIFFFKKNFVILD